DGAEGRRRHGRQPALPVGPGEHHGRDRRAHESVRALKRRLGRLEEVGGGCPADEATCPNLPQPAPTCPNLPQPAPTCPNLPQPAPTSPTTSPPRPNPPHLPPPPPTPRPP